MPCPYSYEDKGYCACGERVPCGGVKKAPMLRSAGITPLPLDKLGDALAHVLGEALDVFHHEGGDVALGILD